MELVKPSSLLRPGVPSPTLRTSGGYLVSIAPGVDEVVIQHNNVDVLRIGLGDGMTIKSLGDLSIEAPNINLKATNAVKIESGSRMWLTSGSTATVLSLSNMIIRSFGLMDVHSSSDIAINGAPVNINHGTLEVS